MKPHSEMRAQIELAIQTLKPALAASISDMDRCTRPIQTITRVRTTPTAAVYIAWDVYGRCRYVGSVRRPTARAAVRDRLREHLDHADRRAGWYALTILPLRADLDLYRVHLCEGWVAHHLHPIDGSAHPVISTELPLVMALVA